MVEKLSNVAEKKLGRRHRERLQAVRPQDPIVKVDVISKSLRVLFRSSIDEM